VKTMLSVGDVLNKVSIRDAVYTTSILGLAYHAYLCYNTLRVTSHQHKNSQDGLVSLGHTQADIPFGFSMGEDA
jgi:hypothetical protein